MVSISGCQRSFQKCKMAISFVLKNDWMDYRQGSREWSLEHRVGGCLWENRSCLEYSLSENIGGDQTEKMGLG